MKRPANVFGFGCNTYSYTHSHTAADCVAHLANLGFHDFELMSIPGHLWPSELDGPARKKLRLHFASVGTRVVALNMPNVDMNLAGLAQETRRYTLDQLISIINLAADLEVPGVIITPGKANPLFPPAKERLTGYFSAALDELCPIAEKAGLGLWVENVPFAFLPRISELVSVLDHYGNRAIGVVWDAANCHYAHEDPAESLRMCAARLKVVHLSDTNRWRYRHDAVGLGTVPFRDLPAVLSEVGYRGPAMLEVISDNPDRDIIESARRLGEMGFPRHQTSAPKRARAKSSGA